MADLNRIAFVTGSRADYGIMRRYLKLLNDDKFIDLSILATGALLDVTYGKQVDLIYKDGFHVAVEITLNLDSSSQAKIIQTMAEALNKFGLYFEQVKYDLLILLGDRYEMLSIATAAAMQKIPILHIHGGEATYGNYDEFIRHSITKMSLYHFTATREYRNRVIQMGENPENVFNLGALGAENCIYIENRNVPPDIKKLNPKKYFVVLFHPETLTDVNVLTQIRELLSALDCFKKYQFIFLGTNADTYSVVIRKAIQDYVQSHNNSLYFENLHTDAYHYLLKNAICLIGNSSSGIIEAPSLGIPTINIGDRQKGRIRGNSVVDVICKKTDIETAMYHVLDMDNVKAQDNPYYQRESANKYFNTTKDLISRINRGEAKKIKVFFDINF